ncbi:ornithine cyclodeaminase [Roseivivax halodurans JCM 10272]|uniref:Ornithine cyclodeaminase n=1 Tax=Roseivivax halodurans JCM 10272 TaxID=1449350 RepID=X7EKX5_9RHOB|nr:ornithine cyclodeaminase [Roseivivax halodurans]ETX16567.1 ornithine cyclodeaminase [Roseivivax halodurans JCM 10272]
MTDLLTYDALAPKLDWPGAVEALRSGHHLPRAEIGDLFLGPADATLLTRAARIEGLGCGVKSVTVMGGNAVRGLPTVQGAMMLMGPETGELRAVIESRLVTEFKTAADSVLGASLLARPDSRRLLIVGAGVVARSLVSAYTAIFPELEHVEIWARRDEQAKALVDDLSVPGVELSVAGELAEAAGRADIVAAATMAREPVLRGDWIAPGTHVDLIGAFKSDMREADDALIAKGTLFVDSRDTTLGHIGELKIPLEAGVISEADVRGDLYDLVPGTSQGRRGDDEITVYKNGGGAHLDLMIADWIARSAG